MSKATNSALALLLFLTACASTEEPEPAPEATPVTFEGRNAKEWGDAILKGSEREKAVVALGTIGRSAVPELKRILASPAAPVSVAGAKAIVLMPAGSGIDVVPELCEMLASPEESVVVSSCRALQLQGSQAAPAGPALLPLLSRESWLIRYHAARTLGTIHQMDAETKEKLEEMTRRDRDRRVRAMCRQALEGIPVELVDA